MSVYVGLDVHRQRSQVAVIAGDGKSVMTSGDTGASPPRLAAILASPTPAEIHFPPTDNRRWLLDGLDVLLLTGANGTLMAGC